MHSAFSSTVAGWGSFYLLAGTASATLVGLIFVAVSLHLDLVSESGVSAIFTLARRTMSSFILVVVVSLIFLIPDQTPEGLGWSLLALGVVDLLLNVVDVRAVARELQFTVGWRGIAVRVVLAMVLPVVSSIGLILVARTVLAGSTAYLYWMVPIVVLILTSAAFNAWELMLGLARHKRRLSNAAALASADPSGA